MLIKSLNFGPLNGWLRSLHYVYFYPWQVHNFIITCNVHLFSFFSLCVCLVQLHWGLLSSHSLYVLFCDWLLLLDFTTLIILVFKVFYDSFYHCASANGLLVWTLSNCLPIYQHVKVYHMNDDGKWDDQGTRHVTVDRLEVCLFLSAVSIHSLLIKSFWSYNTYFSLLNTIRYPQPNYFINVPSKTNWAAVVVSQRVHSQIPSIAIPYM